MKQRNIRKEGNGGICIKLQSKVGQYIMVIWNNQNFIYL